MFFEDYFKSWKDFTAFVVLWLIAISFAVGLLALLHEMQHV